MLTCDYCGTTLPESDLWDDRCMPCTIKALQARVAELEAKLNYKTLQWEGVKDMLATVEAKVEALREAIQTHKDSFSDPDDHTEEDKALWAALEAELEEENKRLEQDHELIGGA